MSIKNHIYKNIQAIAKTLATDQETKDRYKKAANGGKKWLCFSRWVAEVIARWTDSDAMTYRDSLADRLNSIDIAYVLQYETNSDVVAYLKKRLVAAMKRETTRKRLNLRKAIIDKGLHKPWNGPEGMTTTSKAAASRGCGMICRFYSAMKSDADYLRGDPQGAGHWTHPDCHLYLDWYNRYDAPTCGLSRVQ